MCVFLQRGSCERVSVLTTEGRRKKGWVAQGIGHELNCARKRVEAPIRLSMTRTNALWVLLETRAHLNAGGDRWLNSHVLDIVSLEKLRQFTCRPFPSKGESGRAFTKACSGLGDDAKVVSAAV
ncbi:hypothetical protein JOM56_013207 [Amanita muscaria]